MADNISIIIEIFLEQSDVFQGRAAESAKTFGAALQLIQKNIEGAVTNNEDLAEAMNEVARFVAQNADALDGMAATLTRLTADVARLAIERQSAIQVLGGLWIAGKGIDFIASLVKGLGAASAV